MKHLRSILAVVLAVVMVASLCVFPANAANDTATLKLTPIEAQPGEQFTTTLYVTDGSEIADFDVRLQYDPEMLQLVSAKANKNVDGGVTVNANTPGAINLNYSNVENTYEEMPILDLVFKVDDEAGPGSYPLLKRNPADQSMATRLSDSGDYLDVPIVCDFAELKLFTAGDIDLNGKVEIRDVTHLRRYLARLETLTDYQLVMADAYYDEDVNVRDAVYIQQYLAQFDVNPGNRANIYFYRQDGTLCATKSVVRGNALTKIPAVPLVDGSEGVWSLSAEEKQPADFSAVSKEMKVYAFYEGITPIGEDEYPIEYNLYNNDSYLANVGVPNSNPDRYSSKTGLSLIEPVVAGYDFEGWFDGQGAGANRVTEIPAGTTGKVTLFARWTAQEFPINYECEMGNVPAGTYKVNQNTTLTVPTPSVVPEMANYIFLGWTNEDGELVKTIPAGTTGAQSYTANWISRRNLTRSVGKLGEPIVVEDPSNGQILFAYELGTIENVPLYTIGEVIHANSGLETIHSEEVTSSLSSGTATSIAKDISNATTTSEGWTLSKDWDESTSVSSEYIEAMNWGEQDIISNTISESGTRCVNSTRGGVSTVSDSSGTTATLNEKSSSSGATGGEYTHGAELSVKAKGEIDAHVVKASVEAGITENVEVKQNIKNTNGFESGNTTTTTGNHVESHESNWSTSESYSSSNAASHSTSVAKTLSEQISKTYGYGTNYSTGGAESENAQLAYSMSSNDSYGSTVTYNTSEVRSTSTQYKTNGSMVGDYRMVCAGTVHVFGVVGYDVTTHTYFTYTYNVMDDKTSTFLDYSYNGKFTDYESGILPFEIPNDIYDYVATRTARSENLQIDENGFVTGYTGSDDYVFIPAFVTSTHSGSNRAVKVSGIKTDAFKGNTKLKGVFMSNYITEIPDSAFEGCTSLRGVSCPGVTKIGNNAFKGCTSYEKFSMESYWQACKTCGYVHKSAAALSPSFHCPDCGAGWTNFEKVAPESEYVPEIGTNAFEGVQEVSVIVPNKQVALAVAGCGAKNITLNIGTIADELTDSEIVVPSTADSFTLRGEGKVFSNLKLNSEAAKTTIDGVVFADGTGFPVTVKSSALALQYVTIDSQGYGLLLKADQTNVELYGYTNITSNKGKAVICKDMTVSVSPEAQQEGTTSRMIVTGDVLTCNSDPDRSNVYFSNDTSDFRTISTAEFNSYAKGVFNLTFDANGGELPESERQREVVYGAEYGKLPEPTRTGYTFDGWYTKAEGGTKYADNGTFEEADDLKLYAHWTIKSYKANWSEGTGYNISVNRTSSPYGKAETGAIVSGAVVYYGDVLDVTYSAATGYSINSNGEKSITVTGDVTAETIFATASANDYTYNIVCKSTTGKDLGGTTVTHAYGTTNTVSAPAKTGYTAPADQTVIWDSTSPKTITFTYTPQNYTYNVVYKSSNGTSLGSTTVTKAFDTTNTITAPAKSGYATPATQSVKWDSTTAKTITFVYKPNTVSSVQTIQTGNWWWYNNSTYINFRVDVELGTRRANSIDVRLYWQNTLYNGRYGYQQAFNALVGSAFTGDYEIAATSTFNTMQSGERSSRAVTGWISVPVNPTDTSVYVSASWWDTNGLNGSWGANFQIPTY